MKNYYVYLIRHGITQGNLEGKYIGQTDLSLCPEGAKVIEEYASMDMYPEVRKVYSSPLARCLETAEIIYPEHKLMIVDELCEMNFGEFENKTAEELKDHPVFPKWLAGEKGAEPPFGESNAKFEKRVRTTFEKVADGLMKTGTTEAAIVTHGGVIMTILAAYGIPELPMHEWITPNGCGFTIKINPSLWMRAKKFEVFSEFPYEREELPD